MANKSENVDKLDFKDIYKENFKTLYDIDVSPYIQTYQSGGVDIEYIEWATAWRLAKEFDPLVTFTIHWSENHEPYFKTELGYFVHCSVDLRGAVESDVYALNPKTTEDVATAHQRCLVKCLGRHGLGLKLWEKKEREELKRQRLELIPKSSVSPQVTHSRPPATNAKLQVKPVGDPNEYRIELFLKDDKPHWLNGMTLQEAYDLKKFGVSELVKSYQYYKDKPQKYQPAEFMDQVERFLKMKEGVEGPADEIPPPDDNDRIPF